MIFFQNLLRPSLYPTLNISWLMSRRARCCLAMQVVRGGIGATCWQDWKQRLVPIFKKLSPPHRLSIHKHQRRWEPDTHTIHIQYSQYTIHTKHIQYTTEQEASAQNLTLVCDKREHTHTHVWILQYRLCISSSIHIQCFSIPLFAYNLVQGAPCCLAMQAYERETDLCAKSRLRKCLFLDQGKKNINLFTRFEI